MKVYGLCTEMIGKTLTLWCIGEKKKFLKPLMRGTMSQHITLT